MYIRNSKYKRVYFHFSVLKGIELFKTKIIRLLCGIYNVLGIVVVHMANIA